MSLQNLISAVPLTIGSGASSGSAYLGGQAWIGHTALGAFTPATFDAFTSAGPADGTYGGVYTTPGNAPGNSGVGTIVEEQITGPGTAYRLLTPIPGLFWLRLDGLGTQQTAARTILIYTRPV